MTVFTENCTAGKAHLSCQLFNFYMFVPLRIELFSCITQVLFCLVGLVLEECFGWVCGVFSWVFCLVFFKA